MRRLVPLFLLAACASGPTKRPDDVIPDRPETASWKAFKDPAGTFEVKFPADPEQKEGSNPRFAVTADEGYYEVSGQDTQGGDAIDLCLAEGSNIVAKFSGKIAGKHPITVTGVDGLEMEINATVGGGEIYVVWRCLAWPGARPHMVWAFATAKHDAPVLHGFVESLRPGK